jgi:hypothetical protein
VQFAANEVVSGDRRGCILVWDTEKQRRAEPEKPLKMNIPSASISSERLLSEHGLRRELLHVHASAITCLQLERLRVVSGALDGTICISDLIRGLVLQTLHANTTKYIDRYSYLYIYVYVYIHIHVYRYTDRGTRSCGFGIRIIRMHGSIISGFHAHGLYPDT